MLLHQRNGPSRWIAKPNDFHQQRYTAFAGGDILSYAVISNRTNPPSTAFSNFLFNHSTYSKLLVYTDGGHDFNRNGVYERAGPYHAALRYLRWP